MEVIKMGNIILETVEEYGEKRGRMNEKEETAHKMISKGYDSLEIIELTGLSVERVREIREAMRSATA